MQLSPFRVRFATGAAIAFLVVAALVWLGGQFASAANPQDCLSDGNNGCPAIGNCPTPLPPGGVYYCDRANGPSSQTCQAGTHLCTGTLTASCGVSKWCGSNAYTGTHQWCNPDGSGCIQVPDTCTQTANTCSQIQGQGGN